MTAFELKLVNGRLATSADVRPVDIGIREGRIDNVASDHIPYPLALKERDIWGSMAGIPGIQTMFPILLSEEVKRGRIDVPQLW